MAAAISIHNVAHIIVGTNHQSIEFKFPTQEVYDLAVERTTTWSHKLNTLQNNCYGADGVIAFVGEDILGGLENLKAEVERAINNYKAQMEADNE